MSNASTPPRLLIIGGGSAAFSGAIQAHKLGVRATIINDGLPLGGTCVNVGCVPSKTLLRAAEAYHQPTQHRFAGIEGTSRLADFRRIIDQKRHLVQSLRQAKYRDVIQPLDDVEVIEGHGRFVDPTTVEVDGKSIASDAVVVATGARPSIPPIPGLDNIDYLTNETAFELEEIPKSMAVIGANYVGLEAAQLFGRFGTEVTVVERRKQILFGETAELAGELRRHLTDEGLAVWTGAEPRNISPSERGAHLQIEVDGETKLLDVEKVLVATGRTPNTTDLGLEAAGVETDEGGICVDSHLETSTDGIFAAGDVIGEPMFVYTAAYEGKLAARHAVGGPRTPIDYRPLPRVVFTDPQVAGVGLDEQQAAAKGFAPQTTTLPLAEVPRAIAARDTRGVITLIRDRPTDRLLGARIVAAEGGEMLMEVAMAIKHDMTIEDIADTLHPYLTLSEGIRLAALTFEMSAQELSCCAG